MNSDILKRLQASCMPAQRQLSAGVRPSDLRQTLLPRDLFFGSFRRGPGMPLMKTQAVMWKM